MSRNKVKSKPQNMILWLKGIQHILMLTKRSVKKKLTGLSAPRGSSTNRVLRTGSKKAVKALKEVTGEAEFAE